LLPIAHPFSVILTGFALAQANEEGAKRVQTKDCDGGEAWHAAYRGAVGVLLIKILQALLVNDSRRTVRITI
jgi:hypothetical protein